MIFSLEVVSDIQADGGIAIEYSTCIWTFISLLAGNRSSLPSGKSRVSLLITEPLNP